MTIASAFLTLCDNLHAATGVEATIGHPAEQTSPGNNLSILVWPWKMVQDTSRNNKAIEHPEQDGTRTNPALGLTIVDCLIFVQAGSMLERLTLLETMQRSLLEQPLMLAADHSGLAKTRLNELPMDQLTSLFSAALIPLTICLSLRVISEDNPVAEKKDSAPILTRRKVKLPR